MHHDSQIQMPKTTRCRSLRTVRHRNGALRRRVAWTLSLFVVVAIAAWLAWESWIYWSIVRSVDVVGGSRSVTLDWPNGGPHWIAVDAERVGQLDEDAVLRLLNAQRWNPSLRQLNLNGQSLTTLHMQALSGTRVERVDLIGSMMNADAASALMEVSSLQSVYCDPLLEPVLRSAKITLRPSLSLSVVDRETKPTIREPHGLGVREDQ